MPSQPPIRSRPLQLAASRAQVLCVFQVTMSALQAVVEKQLHWKDVASQLVT
jgi:hypothetical protein